MTTNYSARWTGVWRHRNRKLYRGIHRQDGYRVWIDGELLVEDWTAHRPSTTQTKAIHLEKGKTYAIKIEYFQTLRSAEAQN